MRNAEFVIRNAECGMWNCFELAMRRNCFELAMRNAQCAINYNSPIESTRLEGVSFVAYIRMCRRRPWIGMKGQWVMGECGIVLNEQGAIRNCFELAMRNSELF